MRNNNLIQMANKLAFILYLSTQHLRTPKVLTILQSKLYRQFNLTGALKHIYLIIELQANAQINYSMKSPPASNLTLIEH